MPPSPVGIRAAKIKFRYSVAATTTSEYFAIERCVCAFVVYVTWRPFVLGAVGCYDLNESKFVAAALIAFRWIYIIANKMKSDANTTCGNVWFSVRSNISPMFSVNSVVVEM